ncbi:DUF1704 domain-containing protein [Candidatus Nomurabacteria bacterium]|nr:DUF1704 domain-containing protein [Candidatus Nomurabacteria bacterium]
MSSEIPKVLVLKSIAPSVESARRDILEYENLDQSVNKHKPYEYKRMDRFWDAEHGSLEEEEAARQLAMQYMLMGSLALQQSMTPESNSIWSERYTKATSEIYGSPDAEIAIALESGIESNVEFKQAAELVREYLDRKYQPVFEALEKNFAEEVDVSPDQVADRFEAGLGVLASRYDLGWKDWVIERSEDASALSVLSDEKKIVVGMKRVAMGPDQVKPLFTHEVLVHAQRSLNGSKISKELQTGLPGYLDAEEGLGVFFEYAISGSIPAKNIDRYTDIAFALGQIDGRQHTREELLSRALDRARKRNEASGDDRSDEDLQKEVYAHVNRIYRGSLGNEHVGVFTKDISYHKGFVEIGKFISSKLDEGFTVEKVLDYLTKGKFDPSNPRHVAVAGELGDGLL